MGEQRTCAIRSHLLRAVDGRFACLPAATIYPYSIHGWWRTAHRMMTRPKKSAKLKGEKMCARELPTTTQKKQHTISPADTMLCFFIVFLSGNVCLWYAIYWGINAAECARFIYIVGARVDKSPFSARWWRKCPPRRYSMITCGDEGHVLGEVERVQCVFYSRASPNVGQIDWTALSCSICKW